MVVEILAISNITNIFVSLLIQPSFFYFLDLLLETDFYAILDFGDFLRFSERWNINWDGPCIYSLIF